MSIEHLGEREFCLKDRDLISVTCLPVASGVGMRQQAKPLAQQGVDFSRTESVADRLKPLRVVTAEYAVVERLITNPFVLQLPFGVFVTVDAELGVVWKVRAEFQEERSELAVHAVEIEVVHHRRGPYQPWISRARLLTAAALGSEHGRLLLGFADEHHSFGLSELLSLFRSNLILALSFAEL